MRQYARFSVEGLMLKIVWCILLGSNFSLMIELAFVSIQVCTAKLYTLLLQGVPIFMEINVGIESSFHLRGIKLYLLSDLKIRNLFTQEIFFFCKYLPIFDRISLTFDRVSSISNRYSLIFDKYSSTFNRESL